jgi:1,4-alpha-glucan branching enzyme
MWLFDAEIYSNMSVFNEETPRVFRGMALHKMIRLISFSLGTQGYLTFMGNEFGHPEWIDFPREGNNWSYHYCRRRWDLSERKDLKYHFLLNFDKLMIELDTKYNILAKSYQYVRSQH